MVHCKVSSNSARSSFGCSASFHVLQYRGCRIVYVRSPDPSADHYGWPVADRDPARHGVLNKIHREIQTFRPRELRGDTDYELQESNPFGPRNHHLPNHRLLEPGGLECPDHHQ